MYSHRLTSEVSRVYIYAFRMLSNIYHKEFCKNRYLLSAINYFRETFHHKYQIGTKLPAILSSHLLVQSQQ